MKALIDRMALDLDILALRAVPEGWSEVLTYEDQWCSLDSEREFPGVVCMRAADDPYHVLWNVCSRFDANGNRYDEAGYDASQPYTHPSTDQDGNCRILLRRHDKAAIGVAAEKGV